jgi:hypothetical protein
MFNKNDEKCLKDFLKYAHLDGFENEVIERAKKMQNAKAGLSVITNSTNLQKRWNLFLEHHKATLGMKPRATFKKNRDKNNLPKL